MRQNAASAAKKAFVSFVCFCPIAPSGLHAALGMRPFFLLVPVSLEVSSVGFDPSDASAVSGKLEQETQMFGLRERSFPFSAMG